MEVSKVRVEEEKYLILLSLDDYLQGNQMKGKLSSITDKVREEKNRINGTRQTWSEAKQTN